MLGNALLLVVSLVLGVLLGRSFLRGGRKRARSWWIQGAIPLALAIISVPKEMYADATGGIVLLLAAVVGTVMGILRLTRPGIIIDRPAGMIEIQGTLPMVVLWFVIFVGGMVLRVATGSHKGNTALDLLLAGAQVLLGTLMCARTAAVYGKYFRTPIPAVTA